MSEGCRQPPILFPHSYNWLTVPCSPFTLVTDYYSGFLPYLKYLPLLLLIYQNITNFQGLGKEKSVYSSRTYPVKYFSYLMNVHDILAKHYGTKNKPQIILLSNPLNSGLSIRLGKTAMYSQQEKGCTAPIPLSIF